ncbi:MAG TPA: ExeM/NucH family extracellular endonuclease [Blastocatellia bacterium]|nr:ExeM/NucH family extracellular endonuclease [Blastocatellia bacterium]
MMKKETRFPKRDSAPRARVVTLITHSLTNRPAGLLAGLIAVALFICLPLLSTMRTSAAGTVSLPTRRPAQAQELAARRSQSAPTVAAPQAALTPGNLIIYRMNDGAAALSANGTAVFLDEYTTGGTLVQSIAVPTTTVGSQRRLVCSGTATTEGFLTRSTDGKYVVFSGYDAAVGTVSITTSTSATVPRVIGRVDANGTLDTSTALTDAISGGNPRGATSTNGTDLWLSGTSGGGGIRYATLGATTSTSLSTTPTNLRATNIFGGQLYVSSQSGAFRLATVGTGTPTMTGQTITNLPGFPTATGSPYGFFFADLDAGVPGVDTVYVADDGGTIQKYSLVGGNWTANGTIAVTTARGITGTVSGSTVTLYITARTTLRTLTDTSGYNATITGSPTTLATAATNTAMQGVAFVPIAAVALPNLTINNVSLNEGNAGTTSFTFTVSLSAPAGPGGVTFDIATADGTATQPSDYTQKSLTAQTIPAGSSTYSFTVLVNGDTTPETNETFFVNVTNVTGATVTAGQGQGQGTIVNDDAAPNLTINDVSLNEGNAGTTTFTFTVSLSAPAPAGGVTFDIATANGTAVQPGDYTAKSLTSQTIPAGSSTYTFDVLVNGDTTPETDETFLVNVTNITNAIGMDTQGQGTIVNDDITKIHDVQGNGAATPIPGATVTVEGVVVANFQGSDKLQGFFLQEEDADADADPATSEGIFIFCNTCPSAVAEGQRVKVTGTVSEFNNMTEITAGTAGSVVVTNAGNNLAQVTPSPIDLPIVGDINAFYEAREGMLVTFVDTLTVSEYFELARFGQIELYEGGRPRQFTEASPPSVAGNLAHQDELARRVVILDDDNNAQEAYLSKPDGMQYVYHPRANGGFSVGTQGTDFFRGGDLVNGLTGVLHWSFPGFGADTWRIRPTNAYPVSFTVANPRPATPPAVGGSIKAVSMNLLNYFTTIDTTSSNSSGPCGPGHDQDCRGADSVAELNRQRERASIVVCSLNADIYAFMELENTTPSDTITDLLGAINARCGGAHPYAFVNTGGTLGTDAIRVQLIYRTGIVSPVGSPLVDLDPIHNRPPTAQTFDVVDPANPAFGERFTVVANHFKSKGCPGTGADADANDGQGCFNDRRTQQASRLLTWINSTVLPAAGDPDILLLGDFNSYAQENPVTTLESGGFSDMETVFHGANAYSYLFSGELGHLDYAFASSSLLAKITGADAWHINADEVDLFDYNDEVKDAGESTFEEKPDGSALVPPRVVFQPGTPYRASDHDPVLVGLFPPCDYTATPTITPGGPTTFCTGDSVVLSSSSADGYQWNLDGSPIGGATSQQYTATASGSYTVTITVGDCMKTSEPTTVTVNPIPPTPTITPGGPTTFCQGGSVTLTSSSASGNQWYLNGSPIGGATGQQYIATANGSYTVTVTASGCTSAASNATTVTVNPTPPTPTITPGGPTTFCAGGSVTLTSSSASGNQWYLDSSPIGGATGQQYVATANGSYTVTVTASGCTSAASSPVVVTVNPIPPTPTITPGGPTTFCQGGSVTLTSSSASGNQWYLNSSPIGGATGQQYVATANGSYTVTVTASGCTSAPSAATTVTVVPPPTTASVGPNQTIAPGGTTAGLGGNTPTSGNGTWTVQSGGTGTFSGLHTGNSTFTHTGGTGPIVLRWTIANPPCADSFAQVTINIGAAPSITCPASPVIAAAATGQCAANVNYTVTASGLPAPTVVCSPPPGASFPVGMTTVSCTASNGVSPNATCSFTVKVNDTQPPVFTNGCPAAISTVTPITCPISTSQTVTYATPAISDNCPGATVACVPPSGSVFATGTTSVTCTATDASGNTATCSFAVRVWTGCLQDESNPGNVVLFDAQTGDYQFCCNGVVTATGTGTLTVRGCTVSFDHIKGNRKIKITADMAVKRGTATLIIANQTTCVITDQNMANNTCTCPSVAQSKH